MSRRIEATPLPHIAALYVRVSDKKQDAPDKTSLATQEQGEHGWAREHGWLTDERFTYRERHTGEELWERPELTRLREAARARSFSVVVCHSIERLSRDPIHLGILIDEFDRIGIAVEFVTEHVDDSPEGALIRFIKGYAGRVENERRRERQIRATRARAELGYPIATGPRTPYGYLWGDADKRAYVIDPLTAPVIVRIFTDYARGMTLRELAASLTAEGIPTPTGKQPAWRSGVIRQLLKTSLYWGVPMTGKTRTERVPLSSRAHYANKSVARLLPTSEQVALPAGVAPALVSPELAAHCTRRLRTNQQFAIRSAKDPEAALLRGMARCGLCGGAVYANRRARSLARKDGSIPSRYVCRNALRVVRDAVHGRICTPHTLSCETLDGAVWAKVASALRDPRIITDEVERMRETEPPGAADLAALDGRIATLSRKIDSLTETVSYATDSETRRDLAGQIDLANTQKRATETERAKVVSLAADWDAERIQLESLSEQISDASENLEEWGYAEKRAALIALRCEVVVYEPGHAGGRAALTLRLPLRGRLALGGDASTSGSQFVL